jgi:PST family polysaccharide transporter
MTVIERRSLWSNFSSLGIIQLSNFALSLIIIPFVISKIGADGFGIIAVAQVVMFYLSVTADYGFNRTAIRDIALYKEDRVKISRVFFTVLFSKLLICIAAFGVLLLLVSIVPLFRLHYEV